MTQVRIRARQEGEPEERERATATLLTELLDLDVEDVVLAAGAEAPPGARAGDLAELGGLMVTLSQFPHALQQLVTAVRDWAGRGQRERTAELVIGDNSLTVTGIDGESQDRLIAAWLQTVSQNPASQDPASHGSGSEAWPADTP